MLRTSSVQSILLLCALAACQPDVEPAQQNEVSPPLQATEAPAGALSAANAPPLGRYVCNHIWWNVAQGRAVFDYKGYFELLSGNEYRWLDNGGTGQYVTDPATGAPTWTSGPLAQKRPNQTTYRLDGSTPEIVLSFEDPVEWQCALESPPA